MPRHVTSRTTLDQLKRDAKRWLRALRDGDPSARDRFIRAVGHPPEGFSLRETQHALAREYGAAGWLELRAHLAQRPSVVEPLSPALIDRFLELACPDHHIRGGAAHVRAQQAALRLLDQHPALATATFSTMVVCGELEGVEDALRADPTLAVRPDPRQRPERAGSGSEGDIFRELGPKGWTPLLFLAFTRLPLAEVSEHAVAIATLLLDRGADPNDHFMAGGSRYTPLVGAIGEGEESRPPHQCRDPLVRLLLERGAEPYDGQVIYNIHFDARVTWFLALMREHAIRRGRAADWDDRDWPFIDMGGYGPGAWFLLQAAIERDRIDEVRWMLEHGANPNIPSWPHPKFAPRASLYERAMRSGRREMAALLLAHGAHPVEVALTAAEQLRDAALAHDRERARALLSAHPELRTSAEPLTGAVARDDAEGVALLLELGLSPNAETTDGEYPLHEAAYRGSVDAARVLLAHGARVDAVGKAYHNTALGGAIYSRQPAMVELLSGLSRDVWELVADGHLARVREVLEEEPALARLGSGGETPLMWLPADEGIALELVRLLLRHGADPTVVNSSGMTAADRAERQGMTRVAAELRAAVAAARERPTMERFTTMVDHLLEAYHTGTPEAMERHWNDTWHRRSWDGMRRYVRGDLGFPDTEEHDLTREEAQWLIARENQFETWEELERYVQSLANRHTLPAGAPVEVRPREGARTARTVSRDWHVVFETLRAGEAMELSANGQMTDDLLSIVADIPTVVSLRLGASKRLTDAGVRHLARMPQLRHLDLGSTGVTDAGLAALEELTQLESLELGMTAVTDAGMQSVHACTSLRRVNLMWTRTGDGTLRALAGIPELGHFTAGGLVTDDGLAALREWPAFSSWRGERAQPALFSEGESGRLWLRGSITDRGMHTLAQLAGLVGLDIADARMPITSAGLRVLAALPHLEALSFEATDATMGAIAALPHLRRLGCQDTVASDDGFVALSASTSLQHIWGRQSLNLRDRGFAALATMPSLHSLAVSCRNVSDEALALLPTFPALRELMPMGVPDEGYRHIGRCEALERLTLMYCRDTGDRATELIAPLRRLREYFASYTRITDRTPALLAQMDSLEKVEFSACAGITDAGAAALARLPRLREVSFGGCRHVTAAVVSAFAPSVDAQRTP